MIRVEKVFDATPFDHELEEFLKEVDVKFLVIIYLIAWVHDLFLIKIE